MIILEALFFIFPAYVANACATLSMSIPILKQFSTPIDFGHSWKGKRILGDGKTFRGFIFGTLCGVAAGVFQYLISKQFHFKYIPTYNNKTLAFFLLTGFLLGLGALLGDLIKSFIKRRLNIKRGRPWPPFDQIDFITGGILLVTTVFFPGWKIVLILFIITPLAHFLTNVAAYFLKLKNVWW
jgi:CDP-2,3-bis-(O-geranylgeranyl)-sn-glycerol synthase